MSKPDDIIRVLKTTLEAKGLDVIIPLTVEHYNQYLLSCKTSDLTPYLLPYPTTHLNSHLLVLVGNSKALWMPFLHHLWYEIEQEGCILPHPIDRYVKFAVENGVDALKEMNLTLPTNVYWVAETDKSKMILAQRMALAAQAVSHCPASQMCIHPTYGPWLAFRSALVFPIEGLTNLATYVQVQEPSCSHNETLHELLEKQMQEAWGQDSNDSKVSKDLWKKWVLPRINVMPSHPMMYTSDQMLYHYSKDLNFLDLAVRTQASPIFIIPDYSMQYQLAVKAYHRKMYPSDIVIECRSVIQRILKGYAAEHDNGCIDGILLSGGLDTSIIAEANGDIWGNSFVDNHNINFSDRPILNFKHAMTVYVPSKNDQLTIQNNEQAPKPLDAIYATQIVTRLSKLEDDNMISHELFAAAGKLQHHILARSLEEILQHAQSVCNILASFDPMELRNSIVIYAGLEYAHEQLDLKYIMTGDGADEIFCGYSFYSSMNSDDLEIYRSKIMKTMQFTATKLAKSLGMTVLSPFLHPDILAFAKKLRKAEMIGMQTPIARGGECEKFGKLILREAFPEAFSQWRSKQPIEAGAGTTALRSGNYFDTKWTDQEFEQICKLMYRKHKIIIRDREHLFFFEEFLQAYNQDLKNVPRQRHILQATEEKIPSGYCPACLFELSHPDQDFCVTCGHWPTKVTQTNDRNGFGTAALIALEKRKQTLIS